MDNQLGKYILDDRVRRFKTKEELEKYLSELNDESELEVGHGVTIEEKEE